MADDRQGVSSAGRADGGVRMGEAGGDGKKEALVGESK